MKSQKGKQRSSMIELVNSVDQSDSNELVCIGNWLSMWKSNEHLPFNLISNFVTQNQQLYEGTGGAEELI